MKFRFGPLAASLSALAAGVHAQGQYLPAPPPPPPPVLMDQAQAAAIAAKGTLLRYRFQVGDIWRYKITTDTNSTITGTAGSPPVKIKQHVETVYRQTVQEVRLPDGTATLLLEPETVKIVTNGKEQIQTKQARGAITKPRELRLMNTGKSVRCGSEKDAETGAVYPQSAAVLPQRPVKTGDTWKNTVDFGNLGGKLSGVLALDSLDLSNGSGTAHIKITLSGKIEREARGTGAKGSKVSGKVSGTGEILFDNETGTLTRSSSTFRATLSLLPKAVAGKKSAKPSKPANAGWIVLEGKQTVEMLREQPATASVDPIPAQ